jgi:hypothetical protein
MSSDVCALEVAKVHRLRYTAGIIVLSAENPMVAPHGFEILLSYPMCTFVRMPAPGPAPQPPEDKMIHPVVGSGCADMAVVVGPASNHRVQPGYHQLIGREARPGYRVDRHLLVVGITHLLRRIPSVIRWVLHPAHQVGRILLLASQGVIVLFHPA